MYINMKLPDPDSTQKNMTYPLPWQPYSNQTTTNVPVNISVHPASLAKHPRQWTKEEVGVWLMWCTEEYSIEPVNPDKFDLNGKALCLLSRSDFLERLPKNGDVLYNCLQSLTVKSCGGGLLYQSSSVPLATTSVVETTQLHQEPVTSFQSVARGVIFVPSASSCHRTLPHSHAGIPTRSYVPIKPYPTSQDTVNRVPTHITTVPVLNKPVASESEQNLLVREQDKGLEENGTSAVFKDCLRYPYQSVPQPSSPSFPDHKVDNPQYQRSSDCRLLWEFVYQLLMNANFSSFVCWENKEEYVFRIVNPTGLAELWGQQKNRTNMTYEKLSRALRYYYRMNIIKKVQGKRLTYRFLQPPSCIQKGQRGAKPHGRLQMTYGELSPSHNDPSLSDARCPDYDSDANSLTDQSLDDCEDNHKEIEVDLRSRGQCGGNRDKTIWSTMNKSGSPSSHSIEDNVPLKRTHSEALRLNSNAYQADITRLRVDKMPSVNPFHLTSSLYAPSEAKYNLHYHGMEHDGLPPVYRPSPTYPIADGNNLPNFPHDIAKNGCFSVHVVPPAHSNNVIAQGVRDNLKRAHSYDFSTLHIPPFPKRPNQARSASPYKNTQNEPEDLSMKKFANIQDLGKQVKTEGLDNETDQSINKKEEIPQESDGL